MPLFRRAVARCSEELSGAGGPCIARASLTRGRGADIAAVDALDQPEIGDADAALGRHQKILGLDVAMDHAQPVSVRETLRHLRDDLENALPVRRTDLSGLDLVFHRTSGDEVQEQPGQSGDATHKPATDDVGVDAEANPGFRLSDEAFRFLGRVHCLGEREFKGQTSSPFQVVDTQHYALAAVADELAYLETSFQHVPWKEPQYTAAFKTLRQGCEILSKLG